MTTPHVLTPGQLLLLLVLCFALGMGFCGWFHEFPTAVKPGDCAVVVMAGPYWDGQQVFGAKVVWVGREQALVAPWGGHGQLWVRSSNLRESIPCVDRPAPAVLNATQHWDCHHERLVQH